MLMIQVESFSKSQATGSPKQLFLYIKRNGLKPLSEALKTLDHFIIDFSDQQGKYIYVSSLGCWLWPMANTALLYEI